MSYTGSYSFEFDGVSERVMKPILFYEVVQEPERNSSVVYLTLKFQTGVYYGQHEIWGTDSTLEVESSKRSNTNNVFGELGYSKTKTIQTLAVRVSHDRNGRRSARIKAHGKLHSNADGYSIFDYSFETIINLPQIIVKPTFTSIRFNSDLVYNQSNSIVYSLSVPPDSKNNFDISLSDNNISRLDYENVSSGSNQVLTMTADEVNTVIGLMAGLRSKIFKISVYEWDPSGSGGVISSSETNITATTDPIINTDNTPTVSINGDGIDSQMGLYIQNITQIDFDLNPQLNPGATLASATTTIERVGGGFHQTIKGASGTRNVLTQAGTYNISGIVIDNKGIRMRSQTAQFTVTPYSPPSVNSLQAQRQEEEVTTANVTVSTSHDRISGNNITNRLEVSVQRKNEQGQWVNVASFSDDLGANENGQIHTTTVLDNDEILSYDYRVVITDSFSRTSESIITLPAARIVLDIHKNLGVGIGKYHKQGVLDVDGSAYFDGNLNVKPKPVADGLIPQSISIYSPSEYAAEIQYRKVGGEQNARLGYFFIDSSTFGVSNRVGNLQLWSNVGAVQLRAATDNYVTIADEASGGYHSRVADYKISSENGGYQAFYNGIMICWHKITITTTSSTSSYATWNFPVEFSTTEGLVTLASKTNNTGSTRYTEGSIGIGSIDKLSAQVAFTQASGQNKVSGQRMDVQVLAIGRWK